MKKLSLMVIAKAGVSAFAAIGVLTLVMATAGCSASRSATMSAADEITAGQVTRMLDERLYKVNFTRAYPTSAPSFTLNYFYYISVIGDRVESFLPYFGQAYSPVYGSSGEEGLRFEAPISEYAERVKKGGKREITFKARTTQETYNFTLTVFPLGESNLTVMPSRKQSISFSGEMDLEPEFEAVRVE